MLSRKIKLQVDEVFEITFLMMKPQRVHKYIGGKKLRERCELGLSDRNVFDTFKRHQLSQDITNILICVDLPNIYCSLKSTLPLFDTVFWLFS